MTPISQIIEELSSLIHHILDRVSVDEKAYYIKIYNNSKTNKVSIKDAETKRDINEIVLQETLQTMRINKKGNN